MMPQIQLQKNYIPLLKSNSILELVGQASDEEGLMAYVIGGFVRDHLLGRPIKQDIDIVVVGSGIQVAKSFRRKLGEVAKLSVYKNFGTAAVTYGDLQIEFVGARKESYRKDSRNPIVEDGTLEDDQNRRDFTINALAIALNGDNKGQLLDPFDGISDLEKKTIRTPLDPEVTFDDDPLRILRAVRFATQLSFDIDPDTYAAIIKYGERLSIISQERITSEINKIILSEKPSYGFKLLFGAQILESIFPEMQKLQGVKKINGKGHKDNFYHTLQVLDNVASMSENLWLRWAAILHDIAKPATQRFNEKVGWTFHGHEDLGSRWVPKIFRRFKLPMGEPMRYVKKLVRLHLRPIALVSKNVTDSAVRRLLFEAGDEIDDLMTLCRADVTSKNHERVRKYLKNFELVEKKISEVEEKDQLRNFKLPVTGDDIMEYYNLPPSRVVGEIREEIKEAILEGDLKNDREEALIFMKDLGKKRGLMGKNS